MNKTELYKLTEWDWFKLQLQIYALQRRAALFSFFFEFKEEINCVVCSMHGVSIEETLKETTEKSILMEDFFSSWIPSIKRQVSKVLAALPVLSQEFDLETNLEFEIMHDYGMGASLVCRIVGREVSWNEDILNSFNENSNNLLTDEGA